MNKKTESILYEDSFYEKQNSELQEQNQVLHLKNEQLTLENEKLLNELTELKIKENKLRDENYILKENFNTLNIRFVERQSRLESVERFLELSFTKGKGKMDGIEKFSNTTRNYYDETGSYRNDNWSTSETLKPIFK